MKFSLSTPSTPLRDTLRVGVSVLMCFIASAYFIYSQASSRNNIHNRLRLEAIAWRTPSLLNAAEYETLAQTPLQNLDPRTYAEIQRPVIEAKSRESIISRIYTVTFDGDVPRMVLDSEGFPPRSWERLPGQPGKSGDFSKETIYFCALSVYKTGKGWVGELAYPGSTESLVVAMVPLALGTHQTKGVLVVESTSDRLEPTLASLRSAAWSSVLMGTIVSLTVALAVYSFRNKNMLDAARVALSERAEQALIEAVGEAIYRLDPVTDQITWQGNLACFGWTTKKEIPQTRTEWMKDIHPEDIQRCSLAWAAGTNSKWSVEYRLLGKDGHIRWLLDRGQHIWAEKQERLAVGAILNLTPLREAERRLRDVSDAAGEYIWEVDASGHYIFLSDHVSDVLGYPVEKLIGRHLLSFVPPEEIEKVHEKYAALIQDHISFRDFEHRIIRADGATIWLSINGVPFINAQGRITGYRGAGLDISRRKHAERELIREKEAALAADRAKSEFLAVMSHEIRTPLNSVLGFADLLIETPLNESQREQVNMIRHSGDALLILLNDILDFSRIESGKMPIEPSAVDVRICVRDVVDLYSATARSKGITMRVCVDDNVPYTLCTDPGRLRQILLNLVGNAVKFTAAGEVFVSAQRGKGHAPEGRFPLLIEVTDSGIGIPPERIGRLFKSFSQADSSTTRRFGGTGLGLVICKRLAELLGGDVSLVRSSPSGSVFALELALMILPPKSEGGDAREQSTISNSSPQNGAWRVLVVEDNKVNCMLVQRMLLSLGIQSDSAENGLLGLQAHARQPYDIILMDLQMPEMDGQEASIQIRKLESKSPFPTRSYIIALTADAMSGDRQRCLDAGMDDYLSKPIRRSDLAAALDKAVQWLLSARS